MIIGRCDGCGAPIEVTEGADGVVPCAYCGRAIEVSRMIRPATPFDGVRSLGESYVVGQPVMVEWHGREWHATVLACEGAEAWRIRYDGYSSQWDEIVGPERIRPAEPRQRAVARDGRRSSSAIAGAAITILAIAALGVFAASNGAPRSTTTGSAEPANARVLAPDETLAPGTQVIVEWNGSWYDAEVLATRADGTTRIHYVGWDDDWDEDVAATRMRVPR